MTLKVLGGTLKGRALEAPADGGLLRPTSARRREAVFDILRGQLGDFAGLRFLDLFAGTGAVGIEALSQGFAEATFVETDGATVRLIRRNLDRLAVTDRAKVFPEDAARLRRAERAFDVIFLDPPYGDELVDHCLTRVLAGGWLAADGIILAEVAKRSKLGPPAGLEIAREHQHGAGRLVRLLPTDQSPAR